MRLRTIRRAVLASVAGLALNALAAPCLLAASFGGPNDGATATPIKHVVIIIGENRSFDHLFAIYRPRQGQAILNLLSEGIITAHGMPGPNFRAAAQNQATAAKIYTISPNIIGPYTTLPHPAPGIRHARQAIFARRRSQRSPPPPVPTRASCPGISNS